MSLFHKMAHMFGKNKGKVEIVYFGKCRFLYFRCSACKLQSTSFEEISDVNELLEGSDKNRTAHLKKIMSTKTQGKFETLTHKTLAEELDL